MPDMQIDSESDTCPACLMPLTEGPTTSWPSCGAIQHDVHLECAARCGPMQRALAHLHNVQDISRFLEAPCIVCRQPWGASEAALGRARGFCASLEAASFAWPTHGCGCATCRERGVGPSDEVTNPYASRGTRLDGEPSPHATVICDSHPTGPMAWHTSHSRRGWRSEWVCEHRSAGGVGDL